MNSDYEGLMENLEAPNMFNPDIDSRENLENKTTKYPGSILVAVEGRCVVGDVYIIPDPWQAFIFRLAVLPDYRRKRVGTLLMDEAERRIKELGIKEISLFVREENTGAIAMYEKRRYVSWRRKHQGMHKSF